MLHVKRKIKQWLLADFKSFRNAPYKKLTKGDTLHPLSIIYPIYVNNENGIKSVLDNIKYYCAMTQDIRENLSLILVDDCSPISIEVSENLNINYKLIRIDSDIKWNSGGAKNCGVCLCESSRIITADIDMLFPEETLRTCMSYNNFLDGMVYVFDEYVKQKELWERYGVHPNTFFMTKNTYFSLGGYDEDFCGYYGDDLYMNQWINSNIQVYNCGEKMLLTDGVNEKSNQLERKVSWKIYYLLYKKKKKSHSKDMLRFPWHLVKCGYYE